MRKMLLLLAAGTLAMPAAVFAQAYVWIPSGNLGVYYSHANQKVEETDHSPEGSGVGVDGQLNLPFNLFIDGMFQYNKEDYPSDQEQQFGMSLEEQARIGGGMQFYIPGSPLTIFGKVDYVHYRFTSPELVDNLGNTGHLHDNDDGPGFFAGFRTRWPGVQLYGQGGYLSLSDSHGQDYKVGLAVPVGRVTRRRASVELFAEYDWTRLHGNDDAFSNFIPGIFYDYHVGFRIPFY